ncbi:STAS domain-containing protein [Actinoplanes sp. CA-252034]|uniref:STAS domain-containing protein n=1 Tax=Actinoplanes sp. CA-252034 TaxID=3239906 RepID=UPI003D983F2B
MGNPFGVNKHDEGGGVVRMTVTGYLDEDTSAGLTSLVLNAVQQPGVIDVVVDLEHVTFLAAGGVGALLRGRDAALEHGCGHRVVNAFGIVCQVLAATGATEILQVPSALRRPEAFIARAGG